MTRTARLVLLAVLALGSVSLAAQAQTTSATVVATCGTPPVTYAAGTNRAVTQGTDGKLCTDAVLSGDITIGAITIADGGDVTQGAKADAKSTATDTTPVTIMSVLKEISAMEQAPASRAVTQGTAANLNATVVGTGTFANQPAGSVAHDGVGTGVNPLLQGGYASAAAPTDVSADGDAVRAWRLRNGAAATVVTAGGALVGGDAANGLDVDVTRLPALVAGSAIIGKAGIDQTTPGTTNGVSLVPVIAGGTTQYGLQSAASTNSTSVKGSAGTVTAMNLINTTTTIYYLRMYDAASAPTCSSATNFVRSWPIPPSAAAGGAGGIAVNLGAYGSSFSTGVAFCLTASPGSTANDNAATGVFVNLDYK